MPTTATPGTSRKRKPAPSAEPEGFACGYCGKAFKREQSLFAHMCAQKQRFIDRDEKHVKYGFMIFSKWWSMTYRSATPRTYDQFAKSQFYIAFVRFARYLLDINAVEPDEFVNFVLKNAVPIDDWQAAPVYELFLRELNKRESPDRALARNFMLMERWATETGNPWTDFFRAVATPQAVMWIRAGRISPWVIYTAPSAQDLFGRMTPEQHELVQTALDPEFWSDKLAQNAAEVEAIRESLAEAGL